MAKGQGGTRTISVTQAQATEVRNELKTLSKQLPTQQAQVTKAQRELLLARGGYATRNKEMYVDDAGYRSEIDNGIKRAEEKVAKAESKYNATKKQYDALASKYRRMTIKR